MAKWYASCTQKELIACLWSYVPTGSRRERSIASFLLIKTVSRFRPQTCIYSPKSSNMKRIIIVALLGLLSFAANAQCNNYGRGYGYYGRPNMRQWRHAPMAYGYRDFGPRWEFRGNRGFEGQYRGGGGWNRGRSNGQYGYNNQNNNGNA